MNRSDDDNVIITRVRGFGDLRRFVSLPYRLHAGTPWIPPLKLERYAFLTRRLNAFFTHAEAEYFLASRGGRVVGRVSAQVDRAFNEFHGSRWGMFGFLEFEDDQEVLDALLGAAETWLRDRGCDRMVGPMDFQLNDESGVLIEGFELDPVIRQPWHPPYYQKRVESAGLVKAMDLYSWWLDVADRDKVLPILPQVAERARTTYGITIREDDPAAVARRYGRVREGLQRGVVDPTGGSSPYFERGPRRSRLHLSAGLRPGLVHGRRDRRGDGRRRDHGARRQPGAEADAGAAAAVRLVALPAPPTGSSTGCASGSSVCCPSTSTRERRRSCTWSTTTWPPSTPPKWGEASWILETNSAMNRGLEAMGGKIVKRYRVYERSLEGPSAN